MQFQITFSFFGHLHWDCDDFERYHSNHSNYPDSYSGTQCSNLAPNQFPVSCVEFISFAGLLNFVIFHVFLALVLFLQFDSKFEPFPRKWAFACINAVSSRFILIEWCVQCHLTPNRYTKIIEEYSAYGHQRVVMYRSEPDSNLLIFYPYDLRGQTAEPHDIFSGMWWLLMSAWNVPVILCTLHFHIWGRSRCLCFRTSPFAIVTDDSAALQSLMCCSSTAVWRGLY